MFLIFPKGITVKLSHCPASRNIDMRFMVVGATSRHHLSLIFNRIRFNIMGTPMFLSKYKLEMPLSVLGDIGAGVYSLARALFLK